MDKVPQRLFKFRAWDSDSRLLVRLNRLECNKGVLAKKGFIFLQFTGMLDKNGEEVYEMDVLLFQSEKRLVFWSDVNNAWAISFGMDKNYAEPLRQEVVNRGTRLCSYFEIVD